MTRRLPFTEASIARAAKGLKKAGLTVTGMTPDGTLIIGDKGQQSPPLAPGTVQTDPFVEGAKRVGHGKAARKRDRAAS